MTPARSNIEVLIPTFNEEINLPHALRSVVEWADTVYVVDSESTDRTREIAESMGATVVVQKWLGYARQKNWALQALPWKSDWIFILDADEVITPELRDELMAIAAREPGSVAESGFYINRLTRFLGKPIRHSGYFPSYNLRFFKKGCASYEDREVHEHMVVDGATGRCKRLMLHEDRRGLEHFIAKHNRYSTLEARELLLHKESRHGNRATKLERGVALRRWLKYNVQPRLPFPGIWRFLYMYVLRLGFLDGITGFRFALMLATYDFFIAMKLAELKATGREERAVIPGNPPAKVVGLAQEEGALTPTAALSSSATPTPAAASASTPSPPPPPPPPPVVVTPSTPAALRSDADVREGVVEAPVPEARDARADEFVARLQPMDDARIPESGWPARKSVPVSVLIPVKNEQHNLIGCMRRLQWADEIVVVDSQSTDNTIPIAQAMGGDVYQFHYSAEGWPKKKNWSLEHVPWRNEWVLILDADEYMTPALAREIERVVEGRWVADNPAKAGCGDGFWLNRRFMFMGKWIKRCGYYPSWNVRLFKHAYGRYERIGSLKDTGSGDNEVHEHVVLSTGEPGYLKEEFLHYAYPELSVWVEKHNRYTTWEAHVMATGGAGGVRPSLFGGPIERRRWLKHVSRALPARPTLRFLYSYILQRGLMDGYPGYVLCRLMAWYELMSSAKLREMKTPNASCDDRNR